MEGGGKWSNTGLAGRSALSSVLNQCTDQGSTETEIKLASANLCAQTYRKRKFLLELCSM